MRSSCWKTSIGRHSLGESPVTAAVRGTQEVIGAVVASSLTNMAVFLPVLFVQEEAGQLFRDIALAITGALLLSVVVAMTVIPTATSRLFRSTRNRTPDAESRQRALHVVNPTNGDGANGDAHVEPGKPCPSRSNRLIAKHRIVDLAVAPLNAFGDRLLARSWSASIAGPCGARRGDWQSCSDDGWAFPRSVVAVLAEGRIPADRQSQPGDRLRAAAARIQSRRTDEAGQRRSKKSCGPIGTSTPDSPEAQELDFPVIGDFFFVAAGRMVFIGLARTTPSEPASWCRSCSRPSAGLARHDCRRPADQPVRARLAGWPQGRRRDHRSGPRRKLVDLGGQIMGQVMRDHARPPSRSPNRASISPAPRCTSSRSWCRRPTCRSAARDLGFAVNALVDGAYVSDYYLGGKKIDLTVMGERAVRQDYAGH